MRFRQALTKIKRVVIYYINCSIQQKGGNMAECHFFLIEDIFIRYLLLEESQKFVLAKVEISPDKNETRELSQQTGIPRKYLHLEKKELLFNKPVIQNNEQKKIIKFYHLVVPVDLCTIKNVPKKVKIFYDQKKLPEEVRILIELKKEIII